MQGTPSLTEVLLSVSYLSDTSLSNILGQSKQQSGLTIIPIFKCLFLPPGFPAFTSVFSPGLKTSQVEACSRVSWFSPSSSRPMADSREIVTNRDLDVIALAPRKAPVLLEPGFQMLFMSFFFWSPLASDLLSHHPTKQS